MEEATNRPPACAREFGPRCEAPCGLVMCSHVDKSADLHGSAVDEIADLHGRVDETKITVAECIKQLDIWNGRLEAAIDRQAHAALGQHPNDAPADDLPLEQLP